MQQYLLVIRNLNNSTYKEIQCLIIIMQDNKKLKYNKMKTINLKEQVIWVIMKVSWNSKNLNWWDRKKEWKKKRPIIRSPNRKIIRESHPFRETLSPNHNLKKWKHSKNNINKMNMYPMFRNISKEQILSEMITVNQNRTIETHYSMKNKEL